MLDFAQTTKLNQTQHRMTSMVYEWAQPIQHLKTLLLDGVCTRNRYTTSNQYHFNRKPTRTQSTISTRKGINVLWMGAPLPIAKWYFLMFYKYVPAYLPPDTFPMTQNANYRAKYLHTNSQCQILKTGPLKHPRMKSQCQILRTGPLKQPQTNSQCQILQTNTQRCPEQEPQHNKVSHNI